MAARPVPADRPTARADEACAALYRRHGAEILRYCRRRLGEPADAEDVAQQVFVRAYGALLRGERVRLPGHWLLRIARNECRRFVSRRSRVQEVGFDEAIDVTPEDELPRWSPAEIRRALDELVPTQRQALVMRELEGRPYAEIARELRLTVSAVETLLFRARRSLREQLDGVLACGAAERALSLELDGRLPETEKPGLRAHLRGCDDCRRLARRSRARRHALRTLLPFPLHGQLASLGGGAAAGGAAVGTGAVAKALTLLAAGAVSSTVGLTVALPAVAPERAPTKAVVPSEDAETATVRVQTVPATRSRATPPLSAVTGAPTTSEPVAGTTPVTSATRVTTAPAAAASAPATAAGGTQPLTAVVSTVEETAATLDDTVDGLVPALPLPQLQLPPVQPPTLPVQLPPAPDLPPTPLDPILPDLPGGPG